MTNRRTFITAALLGTAAVSFARDKSKDLEVEVTYTGAGTVDEKHKVYVIIWDNADFQKMDSGLPIAVQSIASKSGTAKFTDLKPDTVYLSLGYDPKGEWQADNTPNLTTWLATYSTDDGKPKPIGLHIEKVTKVSATLDNSYRRPPDANGK